MYTTLLCEAQQTSFLALTLRDFVTPLSLKQQKKNIQHAQSFFSTQTQNIKLFPQISCSKYKLSVMFLRRLLAYIWQLPYLMVRNTREKKYAHLLSGLISDRIIYLAKQPYYYLKVPRE